VLGAEKSEQISSGIEMKHVIELSTCLVAALVLLQPAGTFAGVTDAPWKAQWISDQSAAPMGPGVYHFRKSFDLDAKPDAFRVKVSADNRYRLFVNGVEVSSGPARGDLMHWRYETIDIAPYLKAGSNVIAALVWNMGEFRPAAQITLRSAFVLQGEGDVASVIDTNKEWKVLSDQAYSFALVGGLDMGGFYVAGPREKFDAARYPWGWEKPGFDDSSWAAAGTQDQQFVSPGAIPRGSHQFGSAAEWQLVPSKIPLPEMTPTRFSSVRRAENVSVPKGFLAGKAPLTIPAHSRVSLLLDEGKMTIGYPILRTSGGKGATAELVYAEGLFDKDGNKGNRDEIEGKTIRGLRDNVIFDGGSSRDFRPLWLRAWRYLQMDVETGDEPLVIEDVSGIFSAYPFQQHASFESDATWIKPIWEMNWRALRLSAYETFWDTPYYEQLQYVGDTRIEALLSVYQSGDDRLMRNAIEQFDDSRLSEGITASSYPSSMRQQIPPFSLWWVAMVHDYRMLRDDQAFVRARLPGVRSVLSWYEDKVDETGFVGPAPWWNFLDWTIPYDRGVPPGADDGHSTAITLQFVYALQRAAELENSLGHPENGARYTALAQHTVAAVQARAWNAERGLFADSIEKAVFSQQTNTLAVLVGAVPGKADRAVMEKVISDTTLVPTSFYFRFYVDEALRAAGLENAYLPRLEPWRIMIRNGMTTTAETPEPTRSDSHAWSAHPNYGLLATVLGVRPGSPGFKTVVVTPSLGSLKRAKGSMPHPAGTISVSFEKKGASGLAGTVNLPSGITGELRYLQSTLLLSAGRNQFRCDPACKATGS
jgi:hypothetical protein